MLGTDDLVYMRALVAETLWDECVILSETRVADGYGDTTKTWAAAGTVDCRVDPVANSTDEDVVLQGRDTVLTQYQLTVGYDVAITEANRIRFDGNDYHILLVTVDHTYRACKRARIARYE